MLNRVYSIFDRKMRPLRNHVFLAFPKHGIAFARVSEPAFHTLRPILHELAGTDKIVPIATSHDNLDPRTESMLFHGDVELLTAREVLRRYPDIKVIAWVQDPVQRIAFCYDKIIRSENALPAYFAERNFYKGMSADEFIDLISSISDRDADNLFRSQSSYLKYNRRIISDFVFCLEDLYKDIRAFEASCGLEFENKNALAFDEGYFTTSATRTMFEDASLRKQLKIRYRADYELGHSRLKNAA